MTYDTQAYAPDDVYAVLLEKKGPFNTSPHRIDPDVMDYWSNYAGNDHYEFECFRLKKNDRLVWPLGGMFYRPEGLVKAAHKLGNKDLTVTMVRSRLGSISGEKQDQVDRIIRTPKKVPGGKGETRTYRYMGDDLTLGQVADLALKKGNKIIKSKVLNRLWTGWSVYQVINTPYESEGWTRKEQRKLQFNQINHLIETYGKDKALKIWLGEY